MGLEGGVTMRKFPRWSWVVFALAVIALVVTGVVTTFTDAEAKGPCRCPKIYAPVECDNGKVYPNQCVADCRNGKNCVPIGLP
jgi:hypothetical protein